MVNLQFTIFLYELLKIILWIPSLIFSCLNSLKSCRYEFTIFLHKLLKNILWISSLIFFAWTPNYPIVNPQVTIFLHELLNSYCESPDQYCLAWTPKKPIVNPKSTLFLHGHLKILLLVTSWIFSPMEFLKFYC